MFDSICVERDALSGSGMQDVGILMEDLKKSEI